MKFPYCEYVVAELSNYRSDWVADQLHGTSTPPTPTSSSSTTSTKRDADNKKLLLGICKDICNGAQFLHEHQLYPFDLGARCCQLTNDLVAKLGDYGLAKSLFPEDYLSLEISLDAHKRFEGRTIFKPNHSKINMYLFSRIFFSRKKSKSFCF